MYGFIVTLIRVGGLSMVRVNTNHGYLKKQSIKKGTNVSVPFLVMRNYIKQKNFRHSHKSGLHLGL